MCFASYFTSLTSDLQLHFGLDTGVLLIALAAIALLKAVASLRSPEGRAPLLLPGGAEAASVAPSG